MRTVSDIQSFVNETLKDWLVYRSLPVHVRTYTGGGSNGHVCWHIAGKGMNRYKDMTAIDLNLSEKLLTKGTDEDIKMTVSHELMHVIQYNLYSEEELQTMRGTGVPANKVSEYTPNLLELQAEVFCINLCGRSHHSFKGAKEQPLYKETLNSIIHNSLL